MNRKWDGKMLYFMYNKIIKIDIDPYFKRLVNHKLLLLFLLFVFLYRLYYFNYFYVPISDFFAFRFNALDWLSFDLPTSYRLLPLYSWIIGIGAIIFPNNHNAMLYTATIINLLLSMVSLGLIYLISSKFLKKCAFLVVFLVALSPQLAKYTCQPVLEMLLLTAILATIYLDIREDNKRYLLAFLASITRYEGFLLIPMLVLKDFIYSKRKLLPIILGFMSSIGIIVWMTLSYFHSPYINPYVNEAMSKGMVGPRFIISCVRALIFFTPLGYHITKEVFVFVLLLMIVGFYSFFKKSSKAVFLITLFPISYILLHMLFSSNLTRYFFPVLWCPILFTVGGLEYGIEYIYNVIHKKKWFLNIHKKKIFDLFLLSGIIIFSLLIFLISIYFLKVLNGHFIFIIYLTYIACIGLFIVSIFKERNTKNLFFISSIILIFCLLIGFSLYNTQNSMDYTYYEKAEYRLVGEWYTQNAKPDDKMLASRTEVVSYYTNLPWDKYFVRTTSLNCTSKDSACFISELKNKNITYYVTGISGIDDKNTEHFRLIKKFEIGHETALIYKFVP